MIIIGAKGFAKEVLEVLVQRNFEEKILFYDDLSKDIGDKLYNKFEVVRSIDHLRKYFSEAQSKLFTIGVGGPIKRYTLYRKIAAIGGKFTSTISPFSQIGHYSVQIGEGTNLMTGAILTNSICIGKGCLINLNSTIGHDSTINDFVEMSPGVHISGNCMIGAFTYLGTNATVLPGITLGRNVVVGAGAVVTRDIPDNSMVLGIPAKKVKDLPELNI